MNLINPLSIDERDRIKNSSVCIVGCGGIGGYAAEFLIRLGVKNLTVVDGDRFDESNLNRQILCTKDSIGKCKASAVKERALSIAPEVCVKDINEFITEDNVRSVIAESELVIDALDNYESRKLLYTACSELGIPMLFGAIGAWQVQVGLLTSGCGFFDDIPAAPEAHGENVLPFVPAMCAAVQVSEAVKLLSGSGSALEGKIMSIDLFTNERITIDI